MENNIGTITLRCDCNCTMLVVDKYKWTECDFGGNIDYNFSMQDSYLVANNGIVSRIRRAFNVLFGRPIQYNDLYVTDEDSIIKFRDELTELINKNNS